MLPRMMVEFKSDLSPSTIFYDCTNIDIYVILEDISKKLKEGFRVGYVVSYLEHNTLIELSSSTSLYLNHEDLHLIHCNSLKNKSHCVRSLVSKKLDYIYL